MTKPRLLLQPTGAPLKVPGRYKGIWPAPVYVATFANGETGRHSFYSAAGKPIDFERGRAGACWLWRDWSCMDYPKRPDPNHPFGEARRDIVAGHVEHDGQTFADPHFNPGRANATTPKLDQLAVMVNRISKLDWGPRLKALQAAIDQRLAA